MALRNSEEGDFNLLSNKIHFYVDLVFFQRKIINFCQFWSQKRIASHWFLQFECGMPHTGSCVLELYLSWQCCFKEFIESLGHQTQMKVTGHLRQTLKIKHTSNENPSSPYTDVPRTEQTAICSCCYRKRQPSIHAFLAKIDYILKNHAPKYISPLLCFCQVLHQSDVKSSLSKINIYR